MTPTLRTGDIVLLKKYAFRYSRLSILLGAYLPFFKKGIELNKPQRGQMAAFIMPEKYPKWKYFTKRIVGLPGDYVQMKDGVLQINHKPCKMKWIRQTKIRSDNDKWEIGDEYEVTLPIPPYKSYHIYRSKNFKASRDNTPCFKVPEGTVWVCGDNCSALDNFAPEQWKPVKQENLIGEPVFVVANSMSRWQSEQTDSWGLWILQLPWRFVYAVLMIDPFCAPHFAV
jgi:signal peptidase I